VVAVRAIEELHHLRIAGRLGDGDITVAIQVELAEFLIVRPRIRGGGDQEERRGGFHAGLRCSFRTRNR